MSYFNRLRADLLQRLAAVLPERREDMGESGADYFPVDMMRDLGEEFGDTADLLDLAYDVDPPNKISMLVEFERVKWNLDRVPTKEDFERHSSLSIGAYDGEFGSWENFLDKLGHDPWYRDAGATVRNAGQDERPAMQADGHGDATGPVGDDDDNYDGAAILRERIRNILECDSDALKIFEMLESDIHDVDPAVLNRLAEEVRSD